MDCEREFFLCPKCFHVAQASEEHHQRSMFHYSGYRLGDEHIKPLQDGAGNLKSRAPRWFIAQQWPHVLRRPSRAE